MKITRAICIALFCAAAATICRGADDPFSARPSLDRTAEGDVRLSVAFSITLGTHLYADDIKIEAPDGITLTPVNIPPPKQKLDPFEGKIVAQYDADMTFVYKVTGASAEAFTLTVKYRGCSEKECFFPANRKFPLSLATPPATASDTNAPPSPASVAPPATEDSPSGFKVIGRASGYLPPGEFIAFLDNVESGKGIEKDRLQLILEKYGMLAAILAILIGGLGLNLTPCVLPMIPINLAIIGAGAQAGSRARGFVLGGIYGLGIALVYGVLGLVVVLTGSKFGTINSSPWFNLGIAVLFIGLSLAMFGVFNVDFSRFQTQGGPGNRRGGIFSSFGMGCVAALLAGACVAPVVISVLILSANLYAGGNGAGLLLPFLLGVGMALPWPFAGAGLSFLPKPGRWMERVKYGFGVFILIMAIFYGHTGVKILRSRSDSIRDTLKGVQAENLNNGWLSSLEEGMKKARESQKSIFVDCWASWCKNCLAMEETTFKDPVVNRRLDAYVRVKFQAEDLNDPAVRPVLDRFGVLGLPTYVILSPTDAP